MKGTILICLRDMLRNEKNMNDDKWKNILEASGLQRHLTILPMSDIEDAIALNMFSEAQKSYYSNFIEMADAYGRYWCVVYAPKLYATVYAGVTSAKQFLLKMDQVHVMVTSTMKNARPPRFTFETVSANTILVGYSSARGLIHLYAGLARGIGEYFNEKLDVKVLGEDKVSITFPA